jgi:hypothetical protein
LVQHRSLTAITSTEGSVLFSPDLKFRLLTPKHHNIGVVYHTSRGVVELQLLQREGRVERASKIEPFLLGRAALEDSAAGLERGRHVKDIDFTAFGVSKVVAAVGGECATLYRRGLGSERASVCDGVAFERYVAQELDAVDAGVGAEFSFGYSGSSGSV